MEKIFYINKSAYSTTDEAVQKILSDFFGVANATIIRNENGKPFLRNGRDIPLFFSVSHTEDKLFIAFSDENVGIDVENVLRQPHYLPIVKKFALEERAEIASAQDFLRHWTAKEAAVKWLGGSLAHDLQKLVYSKEALKYGEIELPCNLVFLTVENYLVAVCGERDFSKAEIITV